MDNVTISSSATAREILAAIDRWADEGSAREGEDLWEIVTALRGPDDENVDLKNLVTVPVRAATVPRLARLAGALWESSVSLTYGSGAELRAALPWPGTWAALVEQFARAPASPHFLSHARRAWIALFRE